MPALGAAPQLWISPRQLPLPALSSLDPCALHLQPKGADRKQKTDREKMEKRTAQEKEKYQPSYETTILSECSPWPDVVYQVNSASSPSYNGSPSSFGLGEGYVHPLSFESSKVTTGADSFLSFLSVSSLLL